MYMSSEISDPRCFGKVLSVCSIAGVCLLFGMSANVAPSRCEAGESATRAAPGRLVAYDEGFGTPCMADADCANEAVCAADAAGALPGTCYVPKNRYLTLSRNPSNTDPTARRVRLAGGTELGWASEPDGNGVSRVVGAPYYTNAWPDPAYISDCEIAQGYTYWVDSVLDGADVGNPNDYSVVLELPTTSLWADVSDVRWPPDGARRLNEIFRVLDAYTGEGNQLPIAWVDLGPEVPDFVVNYADVVHAMAGFRGLSYPFVVPSDCPQPQPECGNGVPDAGEQCDDGNAEPGDGCDPFCQDETLSAAVMRLVPVDASGPHCARCPCRSTRTPAPRPRAPWWRGSARSWALDWRRAWAARPSPRPGVP